MFGNADAGNPEQGQKAGLTVGIGFMLKKAINVMKGYYVQQNLMVKANEV